MEFDLNNLEPLLATLSRIFENNGNTKLVAILADANAKIEEIDYEGYSNGTEFYHLYLTISDYLFRKIAHEQEELKNQILDTISCVLKPHTKNWCIYEVSISPMLINDNQWREKAYAFIKGENINNQGRVRSDNIASKSCDGLLFRSQQEINLYKAFKALGVSFAPLAVFIRGGENYRRIEPDFLIIKDGITMIVEVDGNTYHRESPADAHTRLNMLTHEGAILERVLASDCDTEEKAKQCASQLIEILKKHKENKK